jgi:hypothetical protein
MNDTPSVDVLNHILSEHTARHEERIDKNNQMNRSIHDIRICIGTRWRCSEGHEWVSAHGDTCWFQMPTTCRECGKQAIEHRGEWRTLKELIV